MTIKNFSYLFVAFGFGMMSTMLFMCDTFPAASSWFFGKTKAALDVMSSRSDEEAIHSTKSIFSRLRPKSRIAPFMELTKKETKKKRLLFVGYMSAPDNFDRREAVRKICFPNITAAGAGVKFFIGRPNEAGTAIDNSQGQLATKLEARLATELQQEADKFNAIVIVPFRDASRDLTDKVTFLFRYGVQEGSAENVLKVDDDWCPNMRRAIATSRKSSPGLARYVGQYFWSGKEYLSMRGRDGTVAGFMTGVGILLSASLIRAIFYDDLVHTLLFAPYGTSSDDANVGKWYEYASRKHPDLKFSRELLPHLVEEIDPKQFQSKVGSS